MDIYRKIGIIGIILITSYILYQLYKNRQTIIQKYEQDKVNSVIERHNNEGFQMQVNPNTYVNPNIKGFIEGFKMQVNPNTYVNPNIKGFIEGFKMQVNPNIEGFQDPIVESISKSNTITPTIATSNFSKIASPEYADPNKSLSICQYAIKASYQTAWDGQDVSQDMIQYVLKRGCRWLQFDVFWDYPSNSVSKESNSYTGVVSYTTDPQFLLSGVSKLAISDVFNAISQNAFTTSPNSGDPLFIQITPKYIDPPEGPGNVSYRSNLYQAIAHSIISQFITSRIYFGSLGPKTSIQSLMGKVVFIIDNTVSPLYATKTYCNTPFPDKRQDPDNMSNCYELMSYMNAVNNDRVNMTTYSYGQLQDMSNNALQVIIDNVNNYNVNTKKINQALPLDKENKIRLANTDSRGMYNNYSINIVPMMYWIYDVPLKRDEAIYNARGAAIAPLSYVQKYIKDNPL